MTEGSWHEEVSHCIASLAAGQLGKPAVYAATHETKSGPVRRTENGTLAGLAYSALKGISASGDADALPTSYSKYLRLVRLGRENEFYSVFGMSPFHVRKTVACSWGVPTGEVKLSLTALPSTQEKVPYSTALSAVEYTTGSFSREAKKFLDKSYLRSGLTPGDDADFESAAKAAGLACSLLMGSGRGELVLADIATASWRHEEAAREAEDASLASRYKIQLGATKYKRAAREIAKSAGVSSPRVSQVCDLNDGRIAPHLSLSEQVRDVSLALVENAPGTLINVSTAPANVSLNRFGEHPLSVGPQEMFDYACNQVKPSPVRSCLQGATAQKTGVGYHFAGKKDGLLAVAVLGEDGSVAVSCVVSEGSHPNSDLTSAVVVLSACLSECQLQRTGGGPYRITGYITGEKRLGSVLSRSVYRDSETAAYAGAEDFADELLRQYNDPLGQNSTDLERTH